MIKQRLACRSILRAAGAPSVGLLNAGELASKDMKVFLGPRNDGGSNRIDLDEVNFHAKTLSLEEIAEQAMRPEIFSEWPASSQGITRSIAQQGEPAMVPSDNPYTASAVDLGKQLFASTDLSMNRNISCATCHQPSRAFTDGVAKPLGNANEAMRNTPAPIAGAFQDFFHWDGSAPTLESQVLHPIMSAGEMNLTGAKLLARLQESQWSTRFQSVYGSAPTLTLAAKALASYLRQINFANNSFDSDLSPLKSNLSASAQKGWRLFNGKANCVACHSGALMSDGRKHDNGLSAVVTSLRPQGDLGASWVDGSAGGRFSFKTPSLRNVSRTAPYFHDGRAATLADVVAFYNRGGDPGARERIGRSPLIRPLNLNDAEVQNLVDFLRALDADILAP